MFGSNNTQANSIFGTNNNNTAPNLNGAQANQSLAPPANGSNTTFSNSLFGGQTNNNNSSTQNNIFGNTSANTTSMFGNKNQPSSSQNPASIFSNQQTNSNNNQNIFAKQTNLNQKKPETNNIFNNPNNPNTNNNPNNNSNNNGSNNIFNNNNNANKTLTPPAQNANSKPGLFGQTNNNSGPGIFSNAQTAQISSTHSFGQIGQTNPKTDQQKQQANVGFFNNLGQGTPNSLFTNKSDNQPKTQNKSSNNAPLNNQSDNKMFVNLNNNPNANDQKTATQQPAGNMFNNINNPTPNKSSQPANSIFANQPTNKEQNVEIKLNKQSSENLPTFGGLNNQNQTNVGSSDKTPPTTTNMFSNENKGNMAETKINPQTQPQERKDQQPMNQEQKLIFDFDNSNKSTNQYVEEWRQTLIDYYQQMHRQTQILKQRLPDKRQNFMIIKNFKYLQPIVTQSKITTTSMLNRIQKRQIEMCTILQQIKEELGSDMSTKYSKNHPISAQLQNCIQIRKQLNSENERYKNDKDDDPSNQQLRNIFFNLDSVENQIRRLNHIIDHYFGRLENSF